MTIKPKPIYPFFVPGPANGYPPYPYGAWPYHAPPPPMILHAPAPTNKGPHAVLSAGPTVVPYNVKIYPSQAIHKAYQTFGTHPILPHSAPTRIRVISKAFPWVIEIQRMQAVTCKDVWKSLHIELQRPITAEEWAHIIRNDSLRRAIKKAHEKRVHPTERPTSPMRRIDYLGEYTLFVGLEKDESYVQNTLMPGAKKAQETWVARFTKST